MSRSVTSAAKETVCAGAEAVITCRTCSLFDHGLPQRRLLHAVLERHPDHPRALRALGVITCEGGDPPRPATSPPAPCNSTPAPTPRRITAWGSSGNRRETALRRSAGSAVPTLDPDPIAFPFPPRPARPEAAVKERTAELPAMTSPSLRVPSELRHGRRVSDKKRHRS
jgi:hypothetical protein